MADVFISYKREDQTYTRKLADSLRQRGFEVWMDDRIDFGDRWWREIVKAVRASAAFVIVMTPDSEGSEWVEREILLAQDEGKPIFPLLLRGRVNPLLINRQYANVTGGRMPPDDFYERLEREVRAPPEEEIVAPVVPQPTVRKDRAWSWRRVRLPLAVVGLLLGLVLVIGVVVIWPGDASPIPKPQPPSNAALHDTWTRPADGTEMVYVPGGTFEMGSTDAEIDAAFEQCEQDRGSGKCKRYWYDNESPRHSVTLDSFWMDRTEVTNAQYALCVADGICSPKSASSSPLRDSYYGDSQFDNYPVIHNNWEDADTYCQWVGGRLPTEAEWEYAARGPDGHIYPWGNDSPNDTLLNYDRNLGDTTEVGSFPGGASWVGALDMAGNVWEWVNDWYDSDYYASSPSHNPKGPKMGDEKVLRGGNWDNTEEVVRATTRMGFQPDPRFNIWGFRCVAELGD